MSVEEASKETETPTSAETKGKASVHRNKSGATSVTSGVFSPTDGTPAASATVIRQNLYALIGHGPYQIRVLGCAVLGLTSVLMEMLAYRVIARPVDHWCRPPEDMSHLTADAWKNQSIPVEADGNYSQCTVYITTSTVRIPCALKSVAFLFRKCIVEGNYNFSIANGGGSCLLYSETAPAALVTRGDQTSLSINGKSNCVLF
ncbi:hypothetical protein MTO96_033820 [Rhipicephalus appendiculatus]